MNVLNNTSSRTLGGPGLASTSHSAAKAGKCIRKRKSVLGMDLGMDNGNGDDDDDEGIAHAKGSSAMGKE